MEDANYINNKKSKREYTIYYIRLTAEYLSRKDKKCLKDFHSKQ